MLPFWLSIAVLSLLQGVTAALPDVLRWQVAERRRSGAWALILPLSIVLFVVAGAALASASADGLTYVALVGVPLGAALALGVLMRGARPPLALLAAALFALAWLLPGSLIGQAAGASLVSLSCVTLGVLIAAVTPARWLYAGIFAMALIDAALVLSRQLQAPNRTLNAAHPVAHLPSLQDAAFGSAVMGYGDLFIAGVLGALAASAWGRRGQLEAAALTAGLALAFDLMFFAVDELPATVPVAAALAVMLVSRRVRSERAAGRAPARSQAAAP